MSNIGALVVSLEANIAKFQSDMGKASAEAEKRAKEIDKAFGIVKTGLTAIGVSFAVGATFDSVKAKIEGVISAAADLEKLSARTGATVEALSGLAAVAKFSGTDTDMLATGLQKLSKSMVDAENGGKKTSASFAAIGISAQDLKSKSPEETFLLLAKQLDKYQDGAGKTVIAQNLLGKAGANLLPVMKDLNVVGEYVTKTTSEQAAQAKEYEDNLMRLSAASNAVYKVIGLALLPTLNDVTIAMLEAQKGTNGVKKSIDDLAASGAIREWAQDAAIFLGVVIGLFQQVAKAASAVGGSFLAVGADLKFAKDVVTGGDLKAALEARNKVVQESNKKYVEFMNFDGLGVANNLGKRFTQNNAVADWAQNADARDMRLRKAAEERAKKPPVPTSGLGNANGPKEPADDPAKKELEGKLKAQEAFIAAEKTLLATREQYLDFFRNLEYFTLREGEQKKQELIAAGLAHTEEAYDKEVAAIQAYLAKAKKLVDQQDGQNKLDEVAKKRAAAEVEASTKIIDSQNKLLAVKQQFDLATAEEARQQGKANDAAQFAIDLMGKSTLDVQKATAAKSIQLALDERIYQLKKLDPTVDTSQAIAEAAVQTAKAQALITAGYDKQRDAAFGASEAVRKYVEEATNNAAQIESALTGAFKGAEDALVSFITTGKADFKGLVNSILADLTRMAVKQQIIAPLAQSLGLDPSGKSSGSGGLFGSIMGLFGKGGASGSGAVLTGAGNATGADLGMAFADGGSPPLNVPSLVGERGPELFMPTSAGTIIPNSALRGSGSGGGDTPSRPISITYQVQGAVDKRTQDQLASATGRAVNTALRRNG